MQDWANRVGLTLQFVAVWFITPQIIGEKAMLDGSGWLQERMEHGRGASREMLRRMNRGLVRLIDRTGRTVRVLVLSIVVTLLGLNALSGDSFLQAVTRGVLLAPVVAYLGFSLIGGLILGVSLLFGGLAVVFDAGGRSPHRFLITGAILFTLGFVVLLAATLLPR